MRDLVVQTLGDDRDGVLIVDDTQMIKKGVKSVGVAPQHCGATNQIENCQVIVMLAYARLADRGGGHAFIGHRLYLPERWTKDPDRCREAGIPKDVVFATKPHQAVELFGEAEDAGVPYGWIAADGGYGQYREVRDWPTQRSKRYVMAVPSSQPLAGVHAKGGQAAVARAGDLLARATRWERRSCGHGAKGERFYDWAFFTVTLPDEPPADRFTHTLMIRRSIADPTEVAYFLGPRPGRDRDERDGRGRRDPVADRGMQRAGQGPDRPGPAPGPHLDRVRTTTSRSACSPTPSPPPEKPACTPPTQRAEGAHRGNDPATNPTPPRQPDTTSGGR